MTGETIQPPNPQPIPEGPAATVPASTATEASGGAMATAEAVIAQNAPWSRSASWPVLLIQAIVLGIVGLFLILAPDTASHTVLEILGLLLFARALVVVYRIVRGQVAPDRVALSAFEAGVNGTVGLLVVIGALLVPPTNEATTALAVVLGVGFIMFGAVSILAALVRRQPGEDLPIARLLLSAAAVVVGILLVVNGTRGFDSVRGSFVLLGWVLLAAGIALGAYAVFVVRTRGSTEQA
jgi:uncharacterized membrane protein HdeD (DUF308 family)